MRLAQAVRWLRVQHFALLPRFRHCLDFDSRVSGPLAETRVARFLVRPAGAALSVARATLLSAAAASGISARGRGRTVIRCSCILILGRRSSCVRRAAPGGAEFEFAASLEADAFADCVFAGLSFAGGALMAARVATSSFNSRGVWEAEDKSISRVAGAKPICEISMR